MQKLFALASIIAAIVIGGFTITSRKQATLPNGMVIKQQFDLKRRHLANLLTAGGRALVAKDVEFICFNDHYVEVVSFIDEFNGIYAADGRVLPATRTHMEQAGLLQGRGSCNGYFKAMIGPSLLYAGTQHPFRPACRFRNRDNEDLKNARWLNWPCSAW